MFTGNRSVWEFGWAYGVGWGAAIFLFGAVVLLLCDKESEELYYKERKVRTYIYKTRPMMYTYVGFINSVTIHNGRFVKCSKLCIYMIMASTLLALILKISYFKTTLLQTNMLGKIRYSFLKLSLKKFFTDGLHSPNVSTLNGMNV